MRKPIIAANWKMNKIIDDAISFVRKFKKLIKKTNVEIVICPPFTALQQIKKELKNTKIKLGAQNCYFKEKGAFTGEVSPVMLKDIGCECVILGHSERRQYFNETNKIINKKIKKAIESGLKPIVCVGEKLEERDSGKEKEVVEKQIRECFDGISIKEMGKIVIAYEPVWAIGTGRNATPVQAQEMHLFIRELLTKLYSKTISDNIRIQYGGSVKPEIMKDFMLQEDIDGALVGGASLDPEIFAKIINY